MCFLNNSGEKVNKAKFFFPFEFALTMKQRGARADIYEPRYDISEQCLAGFLHKHVCSLQVIIINAV